MFVRKRLALDNAGLGVVAALGEVVGREHEAELDDGTTVRDAITANDLKPLQQQRCPTSTADIYEGLIPKEKNLGSLLCWTHSILCIIY